MLCWIIIPKIPTSMPLHDWSNTEGSFMLVQNRTEKEEKNTEQKNILVFSEI